MSRKKPQHSDENQQQKQQHPVSSPKKQSDSPKKESPKLVSRWDDDDDDDLTTGPPSYGQFLNKISYPDDEWEDEVSEKTPETKSESESASPSGKKSRRSRPRKRKSADPQKPAKMLAVEDEFLFDDFDDEDDGLALPSYGRSKHPGKRVTTEDTAPKLQNSLPQTRPSHKKAASEKSPVTTETPAKKSPEKRDSKPAVTASETQKKTAQKAEPRKEESPRHRVTEPRQPRQQTLESTPAPSQKSVPATKTPVAKKTVAKEPDLKDSSSSVVSKPVPSKTPAKIQAKAPVKTSSKPKQESDSVSGFAALKLAPKTLASLDAAGYLKPTPVQEGVIPVILKGTDVMGQAHTGTGKTAAFLIPILEGLDDCDEGHDPVALILVPTRELAVQVRDEAVKLALGRNIRSIACYGGKPIASQISKIQQGVDVVVGTPGRVLDLARRKALSLSSLIWVVLDEADRMLDIGFRPDIEKILRLTPSDRQTILLSATLPQEVVKLAERYMQTPEVVDLSDSHVAVETIEQFYITIDRDRKLPGLIRLLHQENPTQAIIFSRTKRGADRLKRQLEGEFHSLEALHGDMSQKVRDRVMAQFRSGKLKYLVATDVVGRGIDISGISHIINYDIPEFCDDYVHRVGRTGRMGREGVAFTFVTAEEGPELTRIEVRINRLLKRVELEGFNAVSLVTEQEPTISKPVYGKPIRRTRRAL